MDQNIEFFGSDQIQTAQYPEIHPPSQEIRDEVFQAKGDLMKSIQTFLEEFNYIPFEEKPQISLQGWYKFFTIQYAQPEDSKELLQKLLEDLQIINKELKECNHPTFYDKVYEEQKQNMEDTILELDEICRQKVLLCMHDNVDDLIESALNSKLLSINSQRLNKQKQEVKNVVEQLAERSTRIIKSLQNFKVIYKSSTSLKNTSQISPVHAVTPILSTKEPEYSPSMGYKNPNTTPETKSNEIIKSGVEELVPILSENEVTLEDKKECDVPVCENSPNCDDHSEIFSDSKNDDDFQMMAILLKTSSTLKRRFPIQRFINHLIANIESLNDNPTPDRVLNSFVSFPISEESDNSLSDNFSPEFETFCDHTEETRSGNTTTHADNSLPRYDSFCFEIEPDQERLINIMKNDISDDLANDPLLEEADLFLAFDNSIPPDADSELDAGKEIPVMMKDEFDDDNYSSFMFVIYSKMFPSFLSTESEDTIFDPEIPSGEIKYAQPEDSKKLFQKLLEDLHIINRELKECNRPTFSDNKEDHSVQNKENLENSSNSNQVKEGPPQDSDIRQLIREEWCIEVCEEQKPNMEDTILELVEICHQKELLCMHDNVDDLIESALNSKLLSINSQRLNKQKQEVKNVMEQPAEHSTLTPILSTKEPEYSPSMGYENPNTTLETESDEIIKSGVEELVPILSENEVTLEDKKECDVLVCEKSPNCDDHSEIFSDFKNDDDISSDDDAFEDIEYVEASLLDPDIVSVEVENVVHQEEEEIDLEDIFQIQDVILRDIRFLEALLNDDSIPFPNNESSESDFDNPSFLRPPPEPPDADSELDVGKEIPVVIKDEFDDDNYSSFMFVIYSKMFLSFLSAESEDTTFDLGISV
nr:hypothetical protein [Tanacetum cinerariifolium]